MDLKKQAKHNDTKHVDFSCRLFMLINTLAHVSVHPHRVDFYYYQVYKPISGPICAGIEIARNEIEQPRNLNCSLLSTPVCYVQGIFNNKSNGIIVMVKKNITSFMLPK
jgi:hypothetical protein